MTQVAPPASPYRHPAQWWNPQIYGQPSISLNSQDANVVVQLVRQWETAQDSEASPWNHFCEKIQTFITSYFSFPSASASKLHSWTKELDYADKARESFAQNNLSDATLYFNKAIEECKKRSEEDCPLGQYYFGLGSAYFASQNTEKALEFQQKALDWYTESEDTGNIINCLVSIGHTIISMGRCKEGITFVKRAIALAEKFTPDEKLGIAITKSNIGKRCPYFSEEILEYRYQALDELENLVGTQHQLYLDVISETATMLSQNYRYNEAIQLYEGVFQKVEDQELTSCLRENIEQLRSAEAERAELARIKEAHKNSSSIPLYE